MMGEDEKFFRLVNKFDDVFQEKEDVTWSKLQLVYEVWYVCIITVLFFVSIFKQFLVFYFQRDYQ